MFCRNCGNEISDELAVACMKCGCNPRAGNHYCPNCGVQVNENQVICVKCGVGLNTQPQYKPGLTSQFGISGGAKDRSIAGLLALLLGGFGVHQFYLGNTLSGILHIVVTWATCGLGGIISLVEGIRYLTMSDQEFYDTYVKNKREWF